MMDQRNPRDRWINLKIMKIEDGIRGIATVEGRGHKSVKDRVQFILDGELEGDPLATNAEGMVYLDIQNKSSGEHLLQVKVVGYGVMDSKTFTIPDKPKTPKVGSMTLVNICVVGNSRQYTVYVKDEEGKPATGVVIEVTEHIDPPKPLPPTDKNGEVKHTVPFPLKKSIVVIFRIPGTILKIRRWIGPA